jgi:hypothetical protein
MAMVRSHIGEKYTMPIKGYWAKPAFNKAGPKINNTVKEAAA